MLTGICNASVLGLPLNHLRLKIPSFMNHRQHDDIGCLDLVQDAVGVERQLADIFIAEFRHDLPHARQLVEAIDPGDDVLGDLLGVVGGVVSDEVVNGS